MRPESHREQIPEKRCGNCRHSAVPLYKDHLLCFHGDNVEIRYDGLNYKPEVFLDGGNVGLLDGDWYDAVWGGRVVEPTDTCDKWAAEDQQKGGAT